MRLQIDIAEGNDAFHRLLQNLRAPAGLRAGVVTFAPLEAEFLQHAHEIDEVLARAAKGVVIVVCPTKSELVLARLLDLRGAIARLPVVAFLGEDRVTGKIASDKADDLVDHRVSAAKA